MIENRWEHFPHDADIGVRGIGSSKEAAFAEAARALTAVVADPATVAARVKVTLSCAAPDDELLLVDWLNALVYEMATRNTLFSRFEVSIRGHALEATAWGEAVDVARHQPAVEVKGATLSDLSVYRDESGAWTAQCIVDV